MPISMGANTGRDITGWLGDEKDRELPGTPPPASGIPASLAEALAAMGMSDYEYMFTGQGSDIGKKLGLTADQAKKFATFLPQFQSGQFEDLLGGIPEWKKEQLAMLMQQHETGTEATESGYSTGMGSALERYNIGTGAAETKFGLGTERAEQRFGLGTTKAREGFGTDVSNLRAQAFQDMLTAGGIGQTFGASGAGMQARERTRDILGTQYGGMQSNLQSMLRGLGEQRESTLSGLEAERGTTLASLLEGYGTTTEKLQASRKESLENLGLQATAGRSKIEEQADARLGDAYGLLTQYINQVLGLGSQYSAFDPGGGGTGGKGLGYGTGRGKGITTGGKPGSPKYA
jgi:hypothetical protein